MKASDK